MSDAGGTLVRFGHSARGALPGRGNRQRAAAIHVARTYGLAVMGVDINPEQIRPAGAYAQGMEGVEFSVEDTTRLPFQDGEFDAVFTSKSIHHIPNWRDAITERIRVLEPGHHLPNTDLVLPEWSAALGGEFARNRGVYPTPEALTALPEQLGLTQIHSSRVFLGYESVFQS